MLPSFQGGLHLERRNIIPEAISQREGNASIMGIKTYNSSFGRKRTSVPRDYIEMIDLGMVVGDGVGTCR